MHHILDLDRFPLEQQQGTAYAHLVEKCKTSLEKTGMFNLEHFVRPQVAQAAADALAPAFERDAFTHARRHNIYFMPEIPGLDPGHPALKEFETVNHTLCADQLTGNPVMDIYEWPPLRAFLAEVIDKRQLHLMDDPLARVNVMAYHEGEALNWHFDRSEFTVTLLLQAPQSGGEFEYRKDLRTDTDPNYEGVARLIEGNDPEVRRLPLSAGTLNVFRGRNTPHRVTPVGSGRKRIIAVFSYYEQPGVHFTAEERTGFYGRAG